jgi:excisionase family DNA binding protein
MGSDFVSVKEAAKLLKRTSRTVAAYQQRGLLRRVRVGKKVLIPKEDVETLAVEINDNLPPLSRRTFYQLFARVQYLETAVAILKKAAGFGDAPIRPGKEEALGLVDAAQKALDAGSWTYEEIDMWASVYEKLDEASFHEIHSHTGDDESWRPFYGLCVAQTAQIVKMPSFSSSPPLQQLHTRLCGSLGTLRKVVIVWVELNGGTQKITHHGPAIEELLKGLQANVA